MELDDALAFANALQHGDAMSPMVVENGAPASEELTEERNGNAAKYKRIFQIGESASELQDGKHSKKRKEPPLRFNGSILKTVVPEDIDTKAPKKCPQVLSLVHQFST